VKPAVVATSAVSELMTQFAVPVQPPPLQPLKVFDASPIGCSVT
jgi:hypothetical protein